ncbi:MAG: hypothetical protein HY906_17810 [Deltaproteobacteria bacterium]|nr:hypothetical protein [Deltaproteobacteria bacterium]
MTSAFWKLRRFGARALRVVERHKTESTAIAAHEARLAQLSKPFAAAYDEVVRLRSATADAVRSLHATVRAWLPLAQRDVAALVSAEYGGRPEVADDVIADARDLLEQVKGPAGGALPYGAACAAELERGIEAAAKASRDAEAADARYGGLLRQLRQVAAELDAEVQAVRATLSARLGRRDKDLQKMRPHAVNEPDEDDDAGAPAPSPGVGPAAAGVNSPVR